MAKTAGKPEAPLDGVEFPVDEEGKRSTTVINQGAFAAAVEKHSSEAFEAVKAEKKWRFGYAKHVVRQTQLAASSEAAALGIARDGLAYLHSKMEFLRDDKVMQLSEAMSSSTFADKFVTHTIKGQANGLQSHGLEVPYGDKVLRGPEVAAQVEVWVRRGVIELDTGAALCRVAETPSWLDLSGFTFVLFGAGSAMGPFPILMALGAHVVAVDLDVPQIWKRLIKIARESPGTLTVPLKKAVPADASDEDVANAAGCNLLKQTPEVRNWLLSLMPEKQLVLGAYCYLDGPLFVKVSMAMDAIIGDLIEKRKVKPAVAYLCTPTDAHVCTTTARDAAAENLRKQPFWQPVVALVLKILVPKMGMSPNKVKGEADALPVVDALIREQGPNYCLAKRLQHWRAVLSRKAGCVVSSNIAPSTATKSVVSNKLFAFAFKGMHHIKPMEIFYQETSNAVMTALLVHDLQNPQSKANPAIHLDNPMQLFAATSFHGGAWRTGYKFGTIGPAAVIAYIGVAFVVKAYLVAYSAAQFLGWSWGLCSIATGAGLDSWADTVTRLTYLQIAEVVHSAIGIVPSSPVTTGVQICSRVALVQVLNCLPYESWPNLGFVYMMLVSWSITEIVRYLYYVVNTLGLKIPPLTWLRYSTFLVLYPSGVTGELGVIVNFMQGMLLEGAKVAPSIGLAGKCGKAAAFMCFFKVPGAFLAYILGFPMLFGLMLGQRKKNLGRGGGSKSKRA
jgi:hypothetical protein